MTNTNVNTTVENTATTFTAIEKAVMTGGGVGTKKEVFTAVIAILQGVETPTAEQAEILVTKLQHEIELLTNRKDSKAVTEKRQANENLKNEIIKVLTDGGKPMTITEIQTANTEIFGGMSNQKISALLTQLINANKVIRSIEKKKAYFSIA